MEAKPALTAPNLIAPKILTVRDERVIMDADLAGLYGVTTKALNQAVKRNAARFPADFVFQLLPEEMAALRSQFVTSKTQLAGDQYDGALRSRFVTTKRGGSRTPPYAFTEHGALMAANILSSPRAVEMSVYVIRAFIQIRRELSRHEVTDRRLAQIEKTLLAHGVALKDICEKIRPLLLPPAEPKRREIGFHAKPADDPQPKGRKP